MSLTLYYHPLASFCHKVLIALYESGTDFERRIVNLADGADRAALQAVWPLAKFPVIHDSARDRNLAETSIIIEYLDRCFPGERSLIPAGWEDALEVRFWDRVFDNYVQAPMQQIVAAHMRGECGISPAATATLDTAYALIDRRMAARDWIAGPGFTMADCAAAPALFYAFAMYPFHPGCTHLQQYFDRLMVRTSVMRVIDEAKPYFRFFPFADGIPVRYR